MSTLTNESTAGDTREFDRLVANTVQAMRHSLGVTVAELGIASGVPHSNIEAIERGDPSTRAERHDIALAVGWLSNNRVARRLTTQPEILPSVAG